MYFRKNNTTDITAASIFVGGALLLLLISTWLLIYGVRLLCSQDKLTPENYGAVGADITFSQANHTQEYINSTYPGISAGLNDNIDWAAINYMMYVKRSKKLQLNSDYYINKPIVIPKSQTRLEINGQGHTIHMVSSSIDAGAAVFLRECMPSAIKEAEKMTRLSAEIKNLQIVCADKTTSGIKLGASNNCLYDGIKIFNADAAIHIEFSLNTTISNVCAYNCRTGIKITGYDNIPHTIFKDKTHSPAATTCNNITVSQLYFYSGNLAHNTQSDAAESDVVYINAANNASICKVVAEGPGPMRSLITIDCTNNVVMKSITFNEFYSEVINGYTSAVINVINMTGRVSISNGINYSRSLLVKAIGLGPSVIDIRNIPWSLGDHNGKQFYNDNCGWVISGLSSMMFNPAEVNTYTGVRGLFTGQVPYPVGHSLNNQHTMITGWNQLKIK